MSKGRFTNCPKASVIYGSDETLYACAPSFEAAMKLYGVDCEMIVGEGMFHCYPLFRICKEAKEYPKACGEMRIDIDRRLQKTLREW